MCWGTVVDLVEERIIVGYGQWAFWCLVFGLTSCFKRGGVLVHIFVGHSFLVFYFVPGFESSAKRFMTKFVHCTQ